MQHIVLQIDDDDPHQLNLECDMCDWEFPLGPGITMSQMIAIAAQHRTVHAVALPTVPM